MHDVILKRHINGMKALQHVTVYILYLFMSGQEKAGFDENSSFIDVGSGLGKPNFHVAQVKNSRFQFYIEFSMKTYQVPKGLTTSRTVFKKRGLTSYYLYIVPWCQRDPCIPEPNR